MTVNPQSASPGAPPADDPYYYGYRIVNHRRPDGTVEAEQVPLTLEDVLHPQEEDHISERPRHELECGYLASVLRTRLGGLDRGVLLADCLVDWGVEGLRNTSPDISVFEDVAVPLDLDRGTFDLADSGGRCVLVIEVVSLHTRENDVLHKVVEYHQAHVPLYVLVDQVREGGPREIIPYEWQPEGYVRLPLDSRDRFLLGMLGVCLGLKAGGIVCYETVSGKELGDYEQVSRELDAAEERAHSAEERARSAEERAHSEAAARHAAEEQARSEAAARLAAEERERQQTATLRALEAELQRLRGETRP